PTRRPSDPIVSDHYTSKTVLLRHRAFTPAMPLQYLRTLTASERTRRANVHLGVSLAFVAGAVNAAGLLAVGEYTSHMTGVVSGMADNLALGRLDLVLADRKSTRLNSSHVKISYAVFCLKKKN